MQCRAVDRQAAADTVPEAVDVDLGQSTTPVVEEALPPDRLRSCRNCRSDAEFARSPYGVAGQVQAGAGLVPVGHSLYDLEADVALTESARERETGDTGPDDQHAHRFTASRRRPGMVPGHPQSTVAT